MALRLRRGTDAERLTITPLEGELIYTTDTKKLFIGDGSTAGGSPVDTDSITDELADLTDVDLTGLADGQTIAYNLANTRFEPANLASAVNDLTDVDTTGVSVGDVLKWNGAAFVPSAEGAVTPGATYEINIDGDLTGSVFSDDSTVLVDGINAQVFGTFKGDVSTSQQIIIDTGAEGNVLTAKNTLGPVLNVTREDFTATYTTSDIIGLRRITYTDSGNTDTTALVEVAYTDRTALAVGTFIEEHCYTLSTAGMNVGSWNSPTERLEVQGNVKANGSIRPGVYADAAARDTAIPTPYEGMLVFLQDTQKFVGYVSDTGLAGGGASNSTAGWVDLY